MHLKSTEIDDKIDALNEMMTTKRIYVVTRLDDGTPATPDTPAVPPTYVDVDEGRITGNGDDFEWPDQGDSNPENEKLFNRLQKSIKRNIEITDPKNFKVTPKPLRYVDISEEMPERKSPARFLKKPMKKQRPAFLRKKKN